MLINHTDHHVDGTKWLITLNISLHALAVEATRQRLRTTHTTYVKTWPIKPARLDQSMDPEDMLRHEMTSIKLGMMSIIKFGVSTKHRCHPNSAAMLPGIEVLHTLYALPMR